MVSDTVKKDPWALPVRILTWLVVLWVGYCLTMVIMERRRIVSEVNKAVEISPTKPAEAAVIMTKAKKDILKMKATAGDKFLTMAGKPFPGIDDQCASIYHSLGAIYVDRFEHEPLIRAYAMSLVHQPLGKGMAIDLGTACMKTENIELGYYAGVLGDNDKPGSGNVFRRFFGKHGKPSWSK